MAILVGVGSSKNSNPEEAVSEAYYQANDTLNGNQPSFLMLLASPTTYNQQGLLNSLKEKSGEAVIIWCSTSGEITSNGPMDNSIALLAVYSDQMRFVPGLGQNIKDDPRKSGVELAENLKSKETDSNPKAAIILPDGLAGNGADIVRGILDVFGSDFVLAGGSAGDDFEFKQTFQYL